MTSSGLPPLQYSLVLVYHFLPQPLQTYLGTNPEIMTSYNLSNTVQFWFTNSAISLGLVYHLLPQPLDQLGTNPAIQIRSGLPPLQYSLALVYHLCNTVQFWFTTSAIQFSFGLSPLQYSLVLVYHLCNTFQFWFTISSRSRSRLISGRTLQYSLVLVQPLCNTVKFWVYHLLLQPLQGRDEPCNTV